MLNAYFFIRKDQKNKDGTHTIYLRITKGTKKKDIATPVRTSLKHWNEKTNRISTRAWDSQRNNLLLDAIMKKAKDIIFNAYIEGKDLSLEEFVKLFKQDEVQNDLYEYIDRIISSSNIAPETRRAYKTFENRLKRFRNKVNIEQIDRDFILDYIDFLQMRGNAVNTIARSVKFLRNILNRAIEEGLIKEHPFKGIKISEIQGERKFLTRLELKKLHDYYNNPGIPKSHRNVLQYFLFNCFVGLRYNDLRNLTWKNIKTAEVNDELVHYIDITMHKTKHQITIPLIPEALRFLPERSEFDEAKVFKVYTNQGTNRILKEIALQLGIDRKITTHVARHTFATLSIDAGIPIEVVSELLGHTEIRTTQIYAKITLNKKLKEIGKIKGVL